LYSFKTKSFLMYFTQISQSGRFSPAFSNREASEGRPLSVSNEGVVALLRPGRAFLIGADERAAALCLPALFAPHLLRSRNWPLSQGSNCRVSDANAFDFAELLEIALGRGGHPRRSTIWYGPREEFLYRLSPRKWTKERL
jgi:hypothetical protein